MPNKPKSTEPAPFSSQDSEASYKHFSTLVAKIPADQTETLNADPVIVRINVQRGVKAVTEHLDRVRAALPLLDVSGMLELPSLALALVFAVSRIFVPASPQEIKARQDRLRPVRGQTLKYLELAAELGLVPSEPVKRIRKFSGAIDEAQDGIAIAAMFTEHATALAKKHPFAVGVLKQLGDDGNWLLQQLQPKGAVPEKKTERSPAALMRDQLWTDLVRRYDDLYQAGVAIWGRRGVDAHVPSLHAREAAGASAEGADEAAAEEAGSGEPAKGKAKGGSSDG